MPKIPRVMKLVHTGSSPTLVQVKNPINTSKYLKAETLSPYPAGLPDVLNWKIIFHGTFLIFSSRFSKADAGHPLRGRKARKNYIKQLVLSVLSGRPDNSCRKISTATLGYYYTYKLVDLDPIIAMLIIAKACYKDDLYYRLRIHNYCRRWITMIIEYFSNKHRTTKLSESFVADYYLQL